MAVGARLYAGINDTVVEYPTETEDRGVMTYATINGHVRMTYRLSYRVSAIVTTRAIIRDDTVVDVSILKIVSRMTGSAVATNRCG